MMAEGRGEFFRILLQGLREKPDRSGSVRRDRGGQRARPRGRTRRQAGGRRSRGRRQPRAEPRPCGGNEHRCPEARTDKKKADIPKATSSVSKENFLERLPSEVLFKILSYLDASSLFCICHVSKLFHQLANDDIMWHRIYMSEFGWKLKWPDDVGVKEELAKDRSTGRWKRMYFQMMTGQEMNKWRRELRDINVYTGLPRQTEWVLRRLNVSWELTLHTQSGWEVTLEQSRAYFFESSTTVRWSGGGFPSYHHISSIQVHGVRKGKAKEPVWRSLILDLDVKTHLCRFMGKDRQMKLMYLPPGVIVGIQRGRSNVAFIMISLHFHKLVEKSLLGSPVCLYSEPVDTPPADDSDPVFGLHSYSLHFVLHNTDTEIMSGHFGQLSCGTGQRQCGLVELKVINRTNMSQHRLLSGSIELPWKSEELEGSVENCCIMTLTLLDEFQKPFWCVSSPVSISMVKSQSCDYSGDNFLTVYSSSEGQVKMKLVWLKEQQQFFLISLTLYVSIRKVNKHFSTKYGS
ncbi:F-box only protein 15-like [Archocentrus centrarchus]|uniref:F-box only protein 15-like n=1 Tax=Archocentrus centrarchus TaxID=63155 RepID=UPI0011EA48AD|nr:F-box only protein 15-like [Archocentrus centrarchus]